MSNKFISIENNITSNHFNLYDYPINTDCNAKRMKLWNPYADILKYEFTNTINMLLKAVDYVENQ